MGIMSQTDTLPRVATMPRKETTMPRKGIWLRHQDRGFAAVALLLSVFLASAGRSEAGRSATDRSRTADPTSLFEEHVAPILERRCLTCHDDVTRKGGLSMQSSGQFASGGRNGAVVIPGDAAGSRLLQKITPRNGKAAMPKNAAPLEDDEIALVAEWIEAGAVWPETLTLAAAAVTDTDWWSLMPPVRPALPTLREAEQSWARTPLDAFVAEKHRELGVAPSPEATRRTLIRRLYYDLVGLPPPPAEVDAFLSAANPSQAYEQLVDRLLASERYGERWARHWLDVVHYADTHGYDKDKLRPNAWPYRDYVIRSFNEDKPYERFVLEQLAGDALYADQADGIVATGFLAAGPWDFIGHAEVPETKIDGMVARNLDRDDMVSTTLNTFMSTTVQCARCHNHKFDPISQKQYYGLQAVFASIDRADRPYDPEPGTAQRRAGLEEARKRLEAEKALAEKAIETAKSDELKALEAELARIREVAEGALDVKQGLSSRSMGYHSQVSQSADTVKWVQVDLGTSQRLDRVVLFGANEYGWADFGFPHRFKIEVSESPELEDAICVADWSHQDYPRPGGRPATFAFEPCSGRYIRVTANHLWSRRTRGSPKTNDWIFALGELLVFHGDRQLRVSRTTHLDSIEGPPGWAAANLTDSVCGGRYLDDILATFGKPSSTNGYHSQFAATSDVEKWVQVDLGAEHSLSAIELVPAYPTDFQDTPGFGFPVRFRLETSGTPDFKDPQTIIEETAADFSNPQGRVVAWSLPSLRSRYVRLTATKLWDRGENHFALALAEMRVLAGDVNVAAEGTVSASDSIDSGRWHRRHLNDGSTSRRQLALDVPTLRALSPKARSSDELSKLEAEVQHRRRIEIGTDLVDKLTRVTDALEANSAAINALPKPRQVYAGTVHKGAGAFRGRAGLGPRDIRVLIRGDVTAPGELVKPGAIAVIPGSDESFDLPADHDESHRRVALARWVTDKRNPLTWRSIVNRVWLYHFGRGIVDSPNDFGRMGERPTHPKLLDWLAVEFRDGGEYLRAGSIKDLHRLIVRSAVYRQASTYREAAAAIDGDNRYFWRMNRRRLDAEAIRDSVLAVSGALDLKMYGPGFRDFVLEKPEHSPHYQYHKHDPDDPTTHRRSVYRFLVRSQQEPFMETLDCADPSRSVAKRNETLSALQALALLNNKFMLSMAKRFATRLEAESTDPREQVGRAFALLLGREPAGIQLDELSAFTNEFGLPNTCRLLFNLNEFVFVD